MNLNKLNIQSLIVLSVLLKEKHITRTSQRLGLTQAAVSAALQKLRLTYNDELLVRVGNTMQLTELAHTLAPKVAKVVEEAKEILTYASDFNPATTNRVFTIAGANYILDWLAPKLSSRFESIAPNASLILHEAKMEEDGQDVISGKIDYLIVYSDNEPLQLKQKALETDEFVVVMSTNNPQAKQELTLQAYQNASHVWTSFRKSSGETFIELDHKKAGLEITPSIVVSNILSALEIVNSSNKLLLLGKTNVSRYKDLFNICTKPAPFHIEPRCTKGYWASFLDNYSWHQWLRNEITSLFIPKDKQ